MWGYAVVDASLEGGCSTGITQKRREGARVVQSVAGAERIRECERSQGSLLVSACSRVSIQLTFSQDGGSVSCGSGRGGALGGARSRVSF